MAWFNANAVGTEPIRISMISPMPFCPSFEPCANDTTVQVRTNSPRIHSGGGLSVVGAVYSVLLRITAFSTTSSTADSTNPTTGLNSSARNTPIACDQSTPEVADPDGAISWFANPTPMIEPIIVCEELAGSPNHHVPRFQTIAAISSAKIIANPAPPPTCRISSTGSRLSTLKATAPDDAITPKKLNTPDHMTATCGG